MEQLARPGTTLITIETLRLAEGYITVRALGPVPVKGLTDPVEVFELTGAGQARTRLQAAVMRGLTRFVGREAEVEHLRRVLTQAGTGRGQVVALLGEAGVGKSRLTYEFTHSHRVQDWLILETSSVPYGKAASYLPVIEMLQGYFNIGDRDGHREMRAKVLGRVLDLDRALEPVVPPLLALLDVPVEDPAWQALNPPERRQRMLDAVKRLLLRESQVQPLLVVFEDLHWIDGETQALLDSLVESLASARLLLLVNYRPEYEHRWASRTAYSQLRLDSLPAESAAELLAALLGPDPRLTPLAQMLVKRGNPFFLEETVRTLVETGALAGERGAYRLTRPVEALQVPATVQTMLAARIDRLPAEEKQLLQAASVIGKGVPYALLAAIADQPEEELRQGLAHLQEAEFLYEAQLFPDLEFRFRHALTHEVAYGGLLQERRRALHARVVQAIESLNRDRLGEQIERLAHHAVRGELREKAVHYLRQAGGKAAARSALPDARAWFEQALGILATLPDSHSNLEQAFDIRLELRRPLILLAETRRTLELLREAEILAERLNDDRRRGRVCAFMTNAHSLVRELDEALVTGTRALEIAGRLGDVGLRIPATTYLEQAQYLRGDHERVVVLATDNLAVLPANRVYDYFGVAAPPSVYDRCWLILSLAELGRFAEATEPAGEAIRLAAPTQHAFTVGMAYWAAGRVHLLRGDWAKARPLFEHATGVFRAGNVALMLPQSVVCSAWLLAQLGESSQALSQLQEGQKLVERQAASGYVAAGWLYAYLGRTALVLGQRGEARRLGDRAIEFLRREPGFAAYAQHLLGDIAAHRDRFDAESGEAHYRKALALAEPRGMRPLAAHCQLGLAKLYRHIGKRQDAQEHLTMAATMYREMGMNYWLQQAEAENEEQARL
jgi:hypothetical protein